MVSAWRFLVFLSLLQYGNTQSRISGFMPGSSPATPNPALDTCMKQAVPKEYNYARSGNHADLIQNWCSVHDDVIPCLDKTIPSASIASDWFLKLIFNETMATRMSKSLCTRFPYISNLTCVDNDMPAVGKCMQWTTKSAIDNFYRLFNNNLDLTTEQQKMASIYACIISVATAGCFHKELKSCPDPKRKLLYDYYIMLSGQCREIAGIQDTTTPDHQNVTETTQNSKSSQDPATQTLFTKGNKGSRGRGNGSPNASSGSAILLLPIVLILTLL